MIKKLIFQINTQYKSIEDFTEHFINKKNLIYDDITSKLQLSDLNISSIKLTCNYKNIIEINYLENKVRFKPFYLILDYTIDNDNPLIELLLQEIITKYIIIIRTLNDTENITKENIKIKKECEHYVNKLKEKKKEKKKYKKKYRNTKKK